MKVAPFGRLSLGPEADTTVLAGRLPDEFVPDAALVIEDHGGLLVSDIDARRTGWRDVSDQS